MKSAIYSFFLLCSLTLAQTLWAQTPKGKVTGKVLDKSSGEAMVGATILVEGTQQGCLTDIEGKFSLSLAAGDYTLIFNYMSYQTDKLPVTVKAGEITYADMTMQEVGATTEAVEITYTIQKSSSLALLTERKNAAVVSDGVSAELIRRTPDRTTSDVLKRVTGASIQEGKFAIIRGMNDRYNTGYLDGALLPSTESDRKAFAFDAIPANLIDNLQILKAGSPDLSGDFGGGIIRINTKAIPEELTQSITIGGQTHSLTTFKNFKQFEKYSGEAFNFYGSKRNLPDVSEKDMKITSAFPTAADQKRLAQNSLLFNHNWNNDSSNAMPNTRFAYSLGLPIELGANRKLGVILALNYSNTRRYSDGFINSFDGTGQTAKLEDKSYLQNISSGGIFNLNYVGAKTEINFRNLLNVNSDNNTILRTGIGNITDAVDVRNTANVVSVNRLYNGIFSVKHIIGKNFLTVNASASYSNVRRQMPDYRIVSYTKTPDFENYMLALGDFFNSSTGRFSSDLKEHLSGYNLDLTTKRFETKNLRTELKAGAFYQNRVRAFSSRSFVYGGTPSETLTYNPAQDLAAANIAADKLYLVEKTSDDIAYYNGAQRVTAVYAMADQKFKERVRAVYGVRYENADIHITNERVKMDIARIQQAVWLPSANLSYSLSEKMNLRAAYYASVNRPEFRELAPFAFFVFDKNAEILGNKNLQVARLNNFDLRWEMFPSGNQVLSVGGFYKTIANPIEFNLDVTQVMTTFTFANQKSATVYGAEFEFRKNFDFLGDYQVCRDLTAFANLALIKSALTFDAGSQAKADRPLQGQSPYIINAGLQYENASGWTGSVVVNRAGRRIAYVGVDPKFGETRQDIYENPRTVIDLQVGKTLGKFNLKFTLGDLLHQNLVFYQDVNNDRKFSEAGGDRTMFKYTHGMTLNLSAAMTF